MLISSGPVAVWTSIVGLVAVLGGLLLIIGFLTPVAAILAGLGAIGIELLWGAAPLSGSGGWLSTGLVVIMAASVVLLGPGAFSIDARLFGRREIIIPPASRSSKP
ncbi:MAG TPA: hypothetical protein VI756_13255 [Blastocatellia bacterium]